ncbi:Heat shock protein 15 [Flavobacterium anhuiense]|uniref:Heat shock protein 15 n=2 Tax=Flavobacteriaceae TaxID=49546 RepID=A0AAC9D2F9_9FLAO|nr:Heat shock protein 15 [Flavobacterium anhuiense]SCY88443.1 ribosome-associated heat shock protein Hsp15 [Flavobacterium anhuiense]
MDFRKIMRIDKYLWCVRYYKTRNMVTEACKKNQITVNGQIAKPSKEVFPTDRITFRKDQITQIITVLDIPQNRVGAKLVDLYQKNETPPEAFAHLEMLKLSKEHSRRTGAGRPTKKDRRDIDDYGDEFYDDEEDHDEN